MSCNPSNNIATDCTYSNADPTADASIVGTQNGNDFPFFGVIAGPGISVTQTPTTVQVDQLATTTSMGMFVNMGQDLTYGVPISYIVEFDASGPGQYDQLNSIVPVTGSVFVSWSVSYVSTNITVQLEDANTGVVLARSAMNFSSIRPDTISSARDLDLVAGQQLRLRIISTSPGQLLLSRSYFTLSVY